MKRSAQESRVSNPSTPDGFAGRGNRRGRLVWVGVVWTLFGALVGLAHAGSPDASEGPSVTPELRAQAVAVVRKTLDEQERWVKVHAAEYLLALDYPQEVEETYVQELKRFENEPQYRVGIWRVLARAAASAPERNRWIEKIRGVFLNTSASDRGHAAETLAKLKYHVREEGDELFDKDAHGKDESLAVGVNWILANSGKEAGVDGLGRLLESNDPKTRGYAAYALRHLATVPEPIREKLAAAFKNERDNSPARAHVIAAAATHAQPGDTAPLEALGKLAAAGEEGERYEACHTLAGLGTNADLPLLVRLMEDDPSADVRATAAYGILRIGRRVPLARTGSCSMRQRIESR